MVDVVGMSLHYLFVVALHTDRSSFVVAYLPSLVETSNLSHHSFDAVHTCYTTLDLVELDCTSGELAAYLEEGMIVVEVIADGPNAGHHESWTVEEDSFVEVDNMLDSVDQDKEAAFLHQYLALHTNSQSYYAVGRRFDLVDCKKAFRKHSLPKPLDQHHKIVVEIYVEVFRIDLVAFEEIVQIVAAVDKDRCRERVEK